MSDDELYDRALTALKHYSEIDNEEILAAKKAVNDFYGKGLNRVQDLSKAIEIFNEIHPNGTIEELQKWAKEKTVIFKVKPENKEE